MQRQRIGIWIILAMAACAALGAWLGRHIGDGGTGMMALIAVLSLVLSAGGVHFIQNGARVVMQPVETGIRNFVSTLERMYTHMHNYDTLEAEHQALLSRVAEYERQARDAEDIREENARLRELLGMIDVMDNLRYIDASLLSWDPSNWTSAFTIDRGADFGIERGDAVMTERRELVGIVTEVGSSWATVQTIIDPGIHVGGLMGTGVSAVVEGNFTLMQQNRVRLSYVPGGELPLINDVITTSGLGGVVPPGLLVGHITQVELEGTGISYFAVIEPAVDLNRLVQVFVIQNLGRHGE